LVNAYVDPLPICGCAMELAGSLQPLRHDAQALVLDRAERPFRPLTISGEQGTAFPAGARRARSGTSILAARARSIARAAVRSRSGRSHALCVVFGSVRSAPGSMHLLIKSGDDASSAGDR